MAIISSILCSITILKQAKRYLGPIWRKEKKIMIDTNQHKIDCLLFYFFSKNKFENLFQQTWTCTVQVKPKHNADMKIDKTFEHSTALISSTHFLNFPFITSFTCKVQRKHQLNYNLSWILWKSESNWVAYFPKNLNLHGLIKIWESSNWKSLSFATSTHFTRIIQMVFQQ